MVVDKVSLGASDDFSCSRPALSSVATTRHMWLLGTGNGASLHSDVLWVDTPVFGGLSTNKKKEKKECRMQVFWTHWVKLTSSVYFFTMATTECKITQLACVMFLWDSRQCSPSFIDNLICSHCI